MDRASIKKNPPRYLSLADATKRFDPTRLDGPSFFQSIVSLQPNEDVYCVTRELLKILNPRTVESACTFRFSIRIDRSDDRGRDQRCVRVHARRSHDARRMFDLHVIGIRWLAYLAIVAAKFDAQQRMAKDGHRTFHTNVVAFELKT